MSAHDGHDHPATKAGRAACRRGKIVNRPEGDAPEPKPKPRRERAVRVDPALPHEFDPLIDRPERCYVCEKAKHARVHSDSPADIGMLFNFRG